MHVMTINYSLNHLCFRQAELRREFYSFRCREVLLNIESFLQSVELRITKHGSSFASANVFGEIVDRTDRSADDTLTSSSDVM